MTEVNVGTGECVRRLGEIAAEVEVASATVFALQRQVTADVRLLAELADNRGSFADTGECLRRLRQLSSDISIASGEIARAEQLMRLELALLHAFTRRGRIGEEF